MEVCNTLDCIRTLGNFSRQICYDGFTSVIAGTVSANLLTPVVIHYQPVRVIQRTTEKNSILSVATKAIEYGPSEDDDSDTENNSIA